jgi:hypothetical protein
MLVKKTMISSKIQQYRFETGSWVRLIEFLKQENTHMKNHLSEMMDHVQGRESLALAEHFQNQFIVKDDVYDHMIYELRIHSLKMREGSQPITVTADMQKNHSHIKEQLSKIQQEHLVLSADYNTYMTSLN